MRTDTERPRNENVFKKRDASLIGPLVEKVLLRIATILPRFPCAIAQEPPVEDEIDILGETLDQSVRLGQTRAALERQLCLPRRASEQVIQHTQKSFSTIAADRPHRTDTCANMAFRSLSGFFATSFIHNLLHALDLAPNPIRSNQCFSNQILDLLQRITRCKPKQDRFVYTRFTDSTK